MSNHSFTEKCVVKCIIQEMKEKKSFLPYSSYHIPPLRLHFGKWSPVHLVAFIKAAMMNYYAMMLSHR